MVHSGHGAVAGVERTRKVRCVVGVIDRPRLEAQERGLRDQAGKDGHGWWRDESASPPSIEDVSGATGSRYPHSLRLVTHA